jgi:hypothetical protein
MTAALPPRKNAAYPLGMDEDAEWRAAELDAARDDFAWEQHMEEEAAQDQVREHLEADLEEWFDEYFEAYFRKKAAAAWEEAWTAYRPVLTGALQRAKRRINEGAFDEAAVLGASATEVLLRECFAKPVLAGMFLGAAWAADLTERFTKDFGAGRIRELVLAVLRHVGLDLSGVKTLGGSDAWVALMGPQGLIAQRNRFVHDLRPVDHDAIRIGFVSAVELLYQSRRFGERLGADAPPPDEI